MLQAFDNAKQRMGDEKQGTDQETAGKARRLKDLKHEIFRVIA